MRSDVSNYVNETAIQAELRATQRLGLKQGWRCIDVSYKAVEEVAVELLRALG